MSHKFDPLLQPQKILQFLIPFEPLPAFSPQKNQSYKLVSFEIVSQYAVMLECSAKGFYSPHYNWKVTSRLSGYFTKILQKNCREFFPTNAYKKEVRYNSNFLLQSLFSCFFDSAALLTEQSTDSIKTVTPSTLPFIYTGSYV